MLALPPVVLNVKVPSIVLPDITIPFFLAAAGSLFVSVAMLVSAIGTESVSYTHLTLPTNREV